MSLCSDGRDSKLLTSIVKIAAKMSIPKSAFIRISTVVPDGFALGAVHEIEVRPPSWLLTGI